MVVFSISAIMTSYSKPIIQHTSTDEFVCLTKLRLFYNKIFIDTRTNFNLKHMYSVGARFFAALCQTDNYLLIICRPYIIYIFLFIIYKQCRPKKSKKKFAALCGHTGRTCLSQFRQHCICISPITWTVTIIYPILYILYYIIWLSINYRLPLNNLQ